MRVDSFSSLTGLHFDLRRPYSGCFEVIKTNLSLIFAGRGFHAWGDFAITFANVTNHRTPTAGDGGCVSFRRRRWATDTRARTARRRRAHPNEGLRRDRDDIDRSCGPGGTSAGDSPKGQRAGQPVAHAAGPPSSIVGSRRVELHALRSANLSGQPLRGGPAPRNPPLSLATKTISHSTTLLTRWIERIQEPAATYGTCRL